LPSRSHSAVAKVFMHGRSQALRLPLAFRLPGDRVRVSRVEGGLLIEPVVTDLDASQRHEFHDRAREASNRTHPAPL
jgi:virulence-associated protein VagC